MRPRAVIIRATRSTEEDDVGTTERSTERWLNQLRKLRLRFDDAYLESAFRSHNFRHNLGNVRFAFLAGIGLWVLWGVLLNPRMLALSDQQAT